MRSLFSVLILVLLASCSKEDSGNDEVQPGVNTIDISGITYRDDTGNLFAGIDQNDWRTDEQFPASITNLLNFSDTLDYSTADTSTIELMCYPNPIHEFFTLLLTSTNPAVMKFVLIDSTSTVIYSGAMQLNPGSNQFYFSLPDSIAPTNKLYRIYYQFYKDATHHFARGHGDILKQP